ncbi:MAG: aminoacyl-tRNA hydrolase [Candidatus Zambryskibacteria bacterium]|nr:aminoacyl-tRNA hydrolase [Candidatus Zambryskibacteria bacterium]
MFYIVGLGNPGEEYKGTRHNTGREAILSFAKKLDFPDWNFDRKSNSQISKSKIGKEPVILILPDTFMNKSGNAISYFIKPKTGLPAQAGKKKSQENLIVVHDDIDLGLGTIKLSYNKGTGGHRGLDSIVKAVKTKEFIRLRIGISPVTPKGKIKKPIGERKVIDFILSKFKPTEQINLKKAFKKSVEALGVIILEGRDKAMNIANQQ